MHKPPEPGTIAAEDFRRIREVFEAALDRPAAERRGFVEEECGGKRSSWRKSSECSWLTRMRTAY